MAAAQYDPYDDPRLRVLDQFDPNGGVAGPLNTTTQAKPAEFAPAPGGYDLEGFRKAWTSTGDVNNAQGWLDQNRNITQGVTLKNEKAYDPSGRFIADLVGNYSGGDPSQRSRIFLDGIGSNGQPRAAAGASAATAAAKSAMGPAAASTANSAYGTQVRDLIMAQLAQLQKPVSADDPAIAAQQNAYRLSRDRSAREERGVMAERAAASGLNSGGAGSGAFDTTLQGIQETAGQDIAGNLANLMGDEQAAKRSQLTTLLNIALQSGDAESVRALQLQLANLDATLTREGRAQQNSQFNASLGQDRYMYDDRMGFDISRAGKDDEYRRAVLASLGG